MRPVLSRVGRRPVGDAEEGAVLVEFALVLPLLALLFLTVIDLGLVVRENQVLQNAAREGARFSALPTSWVDPRNAIATQAAIQQRVVSYCALEGITVDPANVTVNQQYPITVGGLTIWASEVSVQYNRQFLIPGAPLLPFNQVTLRGRAVFRNLY
jgi:Flp pilus assembly protein TadG